MPSHLPPATYFVRDMQLQLRAALDLDDVSRFELILGADHIADLRDHHIHGDVHVSEDGVPLSEAALSSSRSGSPTKPAIIAFGPSICDMGWAVLRRLGRTLSRFESGVWHSSKGKDAPDRSLKLARFVASVAAAHARPVQPRGRRDPERW